MLDFLYQECPKCKGRSRKKIVGKSHEAAEAADGSKVRWVRGGSALKEPFRYWIHSYAETHLCRLCGHEWSVFVVKERPW